MNTLACSPRALLRSESRPTSVTHPVPLTSQPLPRCREQNHFPAAISSQASLAGGLGPGAWEEAFITKRPAFPCQLLSAANLFQLDALQRHCEILCSQTLSVESAVNTYKYAKVKAGDAQPLPTTLQGNTRDQT